MIPPSAILATLVNPSACLLLSFAFFKTLEHSCMSKPPFRPPFLPLKRFPIYSVERRILITQRILQAHQQEEARPFWLAGEVRSRLVLTWLAASGYLLIFVVSGVSKGVMGGFHHGVPNRR